MAGVPGKNKIERGFRIWWDNSSAAAKDLSADLIPGTVTGGGMTLDEIDMTGVSDAVKKALGGYGDSTVTAQFHMNDTATSGAYTVIFNPTTVGSIGTLTLQFGSNGAAPSTGDPDWEGEYVLVNAAVGQANGRMVINCTWKPAAGQSDPAWGTVA